ncbi:MAG: host attachment protein [Paracoccaceae bacterium]|nr:host attachment protein [Paracoccaceae bacterium]
MKPIVTWVVLANARSVNVFAHRGPGNGLSPVKGQTMIAPDTKARNERAGVGHSIAGPGRAAVAQIDPQEKTDVRFAKTAMEQIRKARIQKRFDRLILIAGPHMLGLLRAELDACLQAVLLGEIPKDLSNQPIEAVEFHLGDLVPI